MDFLRSRSPTGGSAAREVRAGTGQTRPRSVTFPVVRRWILAATAAVFVLLPVGFAFSASPGHGPGCKKNKDGTFHGVCHHTRTVTKTKTVIVHVTHSGTQ